MKITRIATGAVLLIAGVLSTCVYAQQWTQPTKEELEMKEMPGYPGAAAVTLFKEQITKDDLHVTQYYYRIKILTEKGKEDANVELATYNARADSYFDIGEDLTVTDIAGRTIHPDGTIIPFTGKPYVKTIEKTDNYVVKARVFTLPDVEVGSIIEYRYAQRLDDHHFMSPHWYIQGDHFVKAAHYAWYPTVHELSNGDGAAITSIGWFPVLPAGTDVTHRTQPGGGLNGEPQQIYELRVKDIPPAPKVEFMPPTESFTYRVLFSFTPYHSGAEFWKSEGKNWSKRADNFIGPNGDLRSATQAVIAGATTSDEKMRRIYAKVMSMENTDYTRERSKQEDKAAGLAQIKSASDVFKRGRGDSTQLTYVFIGMARAAGFKAYAMLVPNRNRTIFVAQWMNMYEQLSATIAIVNVDGKEIYFDPGDRYVPYGALQWNYTYVEGLRQGDNGTTFGETPVLSYKENRTSRVANLTMAEDGSITGTINLSFEGQEAARWRQHALSSDEEGLRTSLRHTLEEMLPKTLRVSVTTIDNVATYDQPLKVTYDVKGGMGTRTGKRLFLPVDLFTANDQATFPQEKRDVHIYFHYPRTTMDAVKINFPVGMEIEGVPENAKFQIAGLSGYERTAVKDPKYVVVRRNFVFGGIMIAKDKYPELRNFYSQFEAKDQESIILKLPTTTASAAPGN